MNEMQLSQIVEHYSRKAYSAAGLVPVTRLPDYKTVYIEQIGEVGRSIILSVFKVDGKSYWAGYSFRSNTVFVRQPDHG